MKQKWEHHDQEESQEITAYHDPFAVVAVGERSPNDRSDENWQVGRQCDDRHGL
jgi:hypothetical protein